MAAHCELVSKVLDNFSKSRGKCQEGMIKMSAGISRDTRELLDLRRKQKPIALLFIKTHVALQ